jgi:DNA-nicking Smr family endonuclease
MAGKRPRGGLTDEDRKIWRKVAKTLTPLGPSKPELDEDAQSEVDVFREAVELSPPQKTAPHQSVAPKAILPPPHRLDGKTFHKLRKGKLKPERRIDLHGLRVEEAHGRLSRFLMESHQRGCRTVLVITGKGNTAARDDNPAMPTRRGIIRQSLPHWLELPPLNRIVLHATAAHHRDGGSGAYYVYLKRAR